MVRFGAFLITIVLVACLEANGPAVLTGDWGGEHLGLSVVQQGTGAQLEYDCATGKIAELIELDDSGRFSVRGEHYPGHGIMRVDQEQVKRPARYDGRVRGDTMVLTVTLTDTNESLGSYTLVRGRSPRVFKCL